MLLKMQLKELTTETTWIRIGITHEWKVKIQDRAEKRQWTPQNLLLKWHIDGFWLLDSSLVLPGCCVTQQNLGAIGLKLKQYLSILIPTLVIPRAWMWCSAFLSGKLLPSPAPAQSLPSSWQIFWESFRLHSLNLLSQVFLASKSNQSLKEFKVEIIFFNLPDRERISWMLIWRVSQTQWTIETDKFMNGRFSAVPGTVALYKMLL